MQLNFIGNYFLPASTICLSGFLLCVSATIALGQQIPVDIELSLAIDVSGSVDDAEYALMMEGYGRAFRSTTLQTLATAGPNASIAVNVVHFSGTARQEIHWTQISDPASAEAFASRLENLPRLLSDSDGTDISEALDVSSSSFTNNGFESNALVISIAGDGEDNQGEAPAPARDRALAAGTSTIHGIVIGDAVGGSVETHYQDQVIGGTSPLLCRALTFEEFSDAILFKLTSAVRLITGECPLLPTTVSFDQAQYSIMSGANLEAGLVIDPVPIGGLYSHGTQLTVRNSTGDLAGFVRPIGSSVLSSKGILVNSQAEGTEGTGRGGLKGSADFFAASKPVEVRSRFASFSIENLPSGTYDLSLDFWNELGSTEDIYVTGCCETLDPFLTFGTAQIQVGSALPTLTNTALRVEAQTGLLQQELTFKNDGSQAITGFRIYVDGLPDDVTLYNGHGFENGVPYVDISVSLAPGESFTVTLEYLRASRILDFTPSYRLEQASAVPPVAGSGDGARLDLRVIEVSGKGVLVEFTTEQGVQYIVEYSDDMSDWKVSPTPVQGTGQRVQWLDAGLPKTLSFPESSRFYRLKISE